MHARTLSLRLLAAGLCLLWTLMAVAVQVAYHPGGPVDAIVGVTAFLPAVVAAAGVVWPPRPDDGRTLMATAWLAIVSGLLVAPSLILLGRTLSAGGRQTLLPSVETAYAGLLALGTTCVFVGLGLVGARAGRPGIRVRAGIAMGLALLVLVTGAFGGVAVANELALLEAGRGASPFGPSDPTLVIQTCSTVPREAAYARVTVTTESQMDGMPLGRVTVRGVRAREAERWTAERATPWTSTPVEFVRIASDAWVHDGGSDWRRAPLDLFGPAPAGTLDDAVRALASTPGGRSAAEDLGIELIDRARARHCRFLVSGPMAMDGFVPLRWLVGPAEGLPDPGLIDPWRGELDYWVFADGQLGMARVTVSGYPPDSWPRTGLTGVITATMTATDRAEPVSVEQPIP